MSTPDNRQLGVAAIFVAAILWGTTGTAATFAPGVSAMAIGAAAMGIGGLLQALMAARSIAARRSALVARMPLVLIGAASVAIYPLVFYASMRVAGVTIGTVISIGSAPLMAALIENRLEGLKLSTRWLTGAAIGVTGMALLAVAEGSGAHALDVSDQNVPLGIALGLLAGFTYSLYSWSARRLMQQGIPSTAAMGAMFGLGGVLLMPVLLVTGGPFLDSWTNASVGIYMALVPMFCGYVCFGYGLARVQASMATTITLLEPVVAAVLAVIIVGERLPPRGWTGVGLVILCLVWTTLPTRRFQAMPGRQASRR